MAMRHDRPTLEIAAYQYREAECLEYDARAPLVAEVVARAIRQQCSALGVEHVGSTAIPGCAGKGINDLAVLYPDDGLVRARRIVDELSFLRQRHRDPFPESRPMRVGALQCDGAPFRIRVHILSASSNEAAEVVAFRDIL